MSTTPASRLLDVWSLRLKTNDNGTTHWSPSLRISVEGLVSRLRSLDPETPVKIDADENRNPMVIFSLSDTGEIIGQIDQPSEATIP